MGDDFFKDFDREFGRTKRQIAGAGCLVVVLNILWILFLAAVIIGGIYVVANYVI